MMQNPFGNQPMNAMQLRQQQQRIREARDQLVMAPMPTDIGSGLARFGQGLGLALQQRRLDNQFPAAPTLGGGNAPQTPPMTPGIQRVANALLGQQNPAGAGFPAAPAMPAGSAPQQPFVPTANSPAAPAAGVVGFPDRPFSFDDDQRDINPHAAANPLNRIIGRGGGGLW